MKVRILLAGLLAAVALPLVFAADDKKDKSSEKDVAAAKEELGKLSEYVGQWTVNGEGTVDGKKAILKDEKWGWAWKFTKDAPPALTAKIADSKFFTAASVTYDATAKAYKAKLTHAKGGEHEYTGTLDKKGMFVLTRTDGKTSDVHTVKLSTAAGGIRLNVVYEVQTGGKGLAGTVYKTSGNKDGESIAGGGKKPECIVTGGAASISVTVGGKEYKVCCSGCADELKANPDKYIKK
jgi:YHS domain-containing protein